jgi:16S rRNA (guanine527-N7)-methyltransferase
VAPGVSRETLEDLAIRYRLPDVAAGQLARLLEALSVEPDPPTTVSDPEAALEAHVADSLSGLEVPEVRKVRRLGDVGAGAGFPGLVLAVATPQAQVDLIESTGRKAAVADRLLQAAQVTNARTVKARAEEWGAVGPALGGGAGAYEVVTARAVGSLAVLVEYAAPLLSVGGVLVAWKGARDAAEEAAAAVAAERLRMAVRGVERVVPFEGAVNRHLHVYEKTGPTPEGFPRRPGMARKRPLG